MAYWKQVLVDRAKRDIRAVSAIPSRWRRRIIADDLIDETRPWLAMQRPEFTDRDLLDMVEVANGLIALNASDDEICNQAESLAMECSRALVRSRDAFGALKAALLVCDRWGVGHPRGETLAAIYRRCCCSLWWRRSLRRAHARKVEGVAIRLNIVHKRGDKYVSKESLDRRRQLEARNRAMLENNIATNEDGDSWTLAELAALSVSNPAIRRGELMVRIRGLEELAREAGYSCEFVTVTCPSSMHSALAATGERNPAYDGTLPREAQNHLRDVWAKSRAALARAGVEYFGLRVAEPHHDGCPHWHMLLFVRPECRGDVVRRSVPRLRAIIRRYALAVGGGERGAREHRCKFVGIDAAKGTAAGYVAKYIAKAVGDVDVGGHGDDGLREYGSTSEIKIKSQNAIKEAVTMSPVAAWAKTHGIRQFQFFGAPPVGLWRAVRRLDVSEVEGDFSMLQAWLASQKIVSDAWKLSSLRHDFPEMENLPQHSKPADYAAFVRACGGIVQWKDCIKFRVSRDEPSGENRYGEKKTKKTVGVVSRSSGVVFRLPVHDWTIYRRSSRIGVSWTRFNNCTPIDAAGRGGNVEVQCIDIDCGRSGGLDWIPDLVEYESKRNEAGG